MKSIDVIHVHILCLVVMEVLTVVMTSEERLEGTDRKDPRGSLGEEQSSRGVQVQRP